MLLHLCDDEKFIDHVIDMFETAAPGENVYYIHKEKKGTLTSIKTQNRSIITEIEFLDGLQKDTTEFEKYHAVILHNIFDSYKIDLIINRNIHANFHWMCWGADLYNLHQFSKGLYLKQTKRILLENYNIKGKIGFFFSESFGVLGSLFYRWFINNESLKTNTIKAIKKINSASTVIPHDFNLIKKNLNRNIEYKAFKYISIENALGNRLSSICIGNNFLVGNSATLSNNHLEAFSAVKKTDWAGRKIIVPLSYGNKLYTQRVIQSGQELFSNSLIPLIEFLPLDDYNKILEDCGNVIMNHLRQQALGNIIISLWLGARVFLNYKNPVYKFLREVGIEVFQIKDLNRIEHLPNYNSLAQKNRPILWKMYGRENVLSETKELIKYLKKEL